MASGHVGWSFATHEERRRQQSQGGNDLLALLLLSVVVISGGAPWPLSQVNVGEKVADCLCALPPPSRCHSSFKVSEALPVSGCTELLESLTTSVFSSSLLFLKISDANRPQKKLKIAKLIILWLALLAATVRSASASRCKLSQSSTSASRASVSTLVIHVRCKEMGTFSRS